MIWLWWGYGLWLVVVVDCGRGGSGAELWVLIVVMVEWVATLRGFQFFYFYFFCFLVVGFIWFWLASGLKNKRDFWSRFKGFNWFWMYNWKFWTTFTNVVFLCSWGKDSMVRVFDSYYVWFLIKWCFSNIWGWGG